MCPGPMSILLAILTMWAYTCHTGEEGDDAYGIASYDEHCSPVNRLADQALQ